MGGLALSEQVDLLIVGGGINGAGIARDAAGRGLSVLLVEQDDLASHTSRWSSKLIHGGLRYLEYYEFRLVREALIEREVLLRAAPHIVWPLTFVLPHSPEQRPAWMVRLGLLLYDHLGGRKILPRLDRRRPGGTGAAMARRSSPGSSAASPMRTAGSRTAASWCSTPWTRPSAVPASAPAPAASAPGATATAGWRNCVGERRPADAGCAPAPWSTPPGPGSRASSSDGLGVSSAKRVRLIKGSHIVVPRLYPGEHPYILQNDDKRIVFVIPFEGAFSLIGTTDVPYEGDPGRRRASPRTRPTICAAWSTATSSARSAPADVVWSYAGVRPLYDDASGDASAVTRDYVFDLDAGPRPGTAAVDLRRQDHDLPQARRARAGQAAAGHGLRARRVDRERGPARRRHPGRGLRGVPRGGAPRRIRGCRSRCCSAGHAPTGPGWRRSSAAPVGSHDLGQDLGGGLYEAEVDYLVEQRMGAHGRRHALAPLAAGPACRRRTRWRGSTRLLEARPPRPRRRRSAMSLRLDGHPPGRAATRSGSTTVTLDLVPGQLYVLLGPTLAGKTSLMRLMAGLDRPTSGRVLVDGVDVTGLSVRKRSVAMVYQQFINYPTLTVYDNIASPLRLQGIATAEIDRQVRDTARMLHIDHLLDRLPAELSGGQQQRLAIARALVKEAQLLLLDEPLVNLDYKLREELRAELRDLFARQQTTVVYATTEPLEALIMGGEVIVMDEGRVLQSGPTVAGLPPAGLAAGRRGLQRPADEHAGGDASRTAWRAAAAAWRCRCRVIWPGCRTARTRLGVRANHLSIRRTATSTTSRSTPRSSCRRSPAPRPSSMSTTAICTGWCRRRACTSMRWAQPVQVYLDPGPPLRVRPPTARSSRRPRASGQG